MIEPTNLGDIIGNITVFFLHSFLKQEVLANKEKLDFFFFGFSVVSERKN